MKTICVTLTILIAANLCTTRNEENIVSPNNICNTENAVHELQWLNKLISDAKNDPNYIETVWIKNNGQQDIIVVKYVVSSVAYFCFDCQGEPVEIADLAFFNSLKDNHKLYSHLNN
jgi:hypothetical protein